MRKRRPESEDRQSQIRETDTSAETDQPRQQQKEIEALEREQRAPPRKRPNAT
jgi:hypothetical protein